MSKDRGQATVELALCLPFVVIFAAVVVEAGLLVTDHIRLWHAAREAARVAAVDADPRSALAAAQRAGPEPVEMALQPRPTDRIQGRLITVALTHRTQGHVPLLGRVLGRTLRAEATMRIEQP